MMCVALVVPHYDVILTFSESFGSIATLKSRRMLTYYTSIGIVRRFLFTRSHITLVYSQRVVSVCKSGYKLPTCSFTPTTQTTRKNTQNFILTVT